ncbi:hypothetical protein [Rhodococcus sp. IEGM 1379]|uniref:hypothetical protein n=1 Tax=Rhodococcus sp. IEGM 1379 TaxID=3047086 RepID=UPI0024B76BA6|nr:hypothetical protein [Rhodococcus sp. IEGM 1379]MDI9917461.1 hypothetical protein [Rhodococcus sp. IEGM 1379]
MTWEPGLVNAGPAKATVAAVTAVVQEGTRWFMYGPVAVDENFQGRGVLSKLLTGLSTVHLASYDLGALFVEAANQKSLAVHRHYGMAELARFTLGEREYVVFTFEPAMFAGRA